MIGSAPPVTAFELIRWARDQSSAHHLTTLEAHVLLLLATYANTERYAWPSVRTLALQSGLRPTPDGRNSSVSAAITRLQDLQLVWTKQGGRGRSSRRELLYKASQPHGVQDGNERSEDSQPHGTQGGMDPQPHDVQVGNGASPTSQPHGYQDPASRQLGHEVPLTAKEENCQTATARSSLTAGREATCPDPRTAGNGPFSAVEALAHTPGLSEDQRADIAALGARAVQFNANAESTS